MAYHDQIASVSVLSKQITECNQQVIKTLEAYHTAKEQTALRKQAWAEVYQINRVFSFIEMPAATILTRDICEAIKHMSDPFNEKDTALLEAIIYNLTILERYIELIIKKPFDLPQLLFSAINDLRKLAGFSLYPESYLFKANHLKVRTNETAETKLDRYEVAKVSRRLRQMFQMGLIEVIRKTNMSGGLNMMARALNRLDEQCGSPSAPNLWWIAQGVIEGIQNGGLLISSNRIKLFAQLDLQMRELGHTDRELNYEQRVKAEKLSFHLLYLVSLSDAKDELSLNLRKHFDLAVTGLTERNLTQEFLLMKGLNDSDYESLFESINDSIVLAQTNLITEDFKAGSNELNNLLKELKQLHSLFSVLDFADIQAELAEAVKQVNATIKDKNNLKDETRAYCSQCLANIETHIIANRTQSAAQSTSLKRESLTEEQLSSCKTARQHIKLALQQIEKYIQNNHDPELLESMPTNIERALKEMNSVITDEFKKMLTELISLCQKHIVKKSVAYTSIELLSDLLCSVEFYLETVENQYLPSPKLFSFAEETFEKLKNQFRF